MQNTQQSSVIDLKDPEGGAEMANFVVKSFAKIMILPAELASIFAHFFTR
ncbi:MAG: hypothetical protein R3309_09160 [Reinekea sp.]|nr:hypothetical protein [Reinekea sp.]